MTVGRKPTNGIPPHAAPCVVTTPLDASDADR
jgi:hypothetical protein